MHATTPPPAPIEALLGQLHARFVGDERGSVADYIPELGKADGRHFGIALATVDGQVYEVGDSRAPFTIQSISKPLVYGLALEDQGAEAVAAKVGVEPSGDAFNAISLEPGTGRPRNPMINAGAIAVAALVGGADEAARRQRVLDAFSAYAGRPLVLDEAVYASEKRTGHRNRAIGHLLLNCGILAGDPEPALDLYFRQCSVQVDTRDLALMAATLANGGVHPVSGRRAVAAEHVASILSVMATCGMYDASGTWMHRVGLPAKSGVGGGIMAVLPGQLGLAVFSPRLDAQGNSHRGVQVFEALSAELGLHSLRPPRTGPGALRARYTLAAVRSKRQRLPAEAACLATQGDEAEVFELQGDLRLSTVEPLFRAVGRAGPGLRTLVLDVQRVTLADPAATRLLARLVERCAAQDQAVVLSRVRRGGPLDDLAGEVGPQAQGHLHHAPQLDAALEWAERRLLTRHGAEPAAAALAGALASQGLAAHPLCAGLSAKDLAVLARHLQELDVPAGEVVVEAGAPADALLLVLGGALSVSVALPGGGRRRLATLGPGMVLGESALLEGGRRSADVMVDREVRLVRLPAAAYRDLAETHPRLALHLMQGLLRGSVQTVARLTAEVGALGS